MSETQAIQPSPPHEEGKPVTANNQVNQLVKPFFLIMILGLPFSILAQTPMYRDGSYYFLSIWQRAATMAPHGRFGDHLIQAPCAFVVAAFHNFTLACLTFDATYCAIPLLSLLLCWLSVKDSKPQYIIWPALAIGITALASHPDYIAENVIASTFVWPIYLCLLTKPGMAKVELILLLSAFVFFLHPSSAPYMILMAIASMVISFVNKEKRFTQWALAFALAGLAWVRITDMQLHPQPYEIGLLKSPTFIQDVFTSGLAPPAGIIGIGSVVTAVVLLLESMRKNSRLPLTLLSCTACGIIAIFWSSCSHLWYQAFWHEKWMLLYFLTIMFCALLDAIWNKSLDPQRLKARMRVLNVIAAFSTICAISTATFWWLDSNRLLETINQSKDQIVIEEDIPWIKETPLDHWSTTAYSMVLQGHYPCKYVMTRANADDYRRTGLVTMTKWDPKFQDNAFKLPTPKHRK